jgi:hypothetical protein
MGFLNLSVQLQDSTGREKNNREKGKSVGRISTYAHNKIQKKPGLATTSQECFNDAPVSNSKRLEGEEGILAAIVLYPCVTI